MNKRIYLLVVIIISCVATGWGQTVSKLDLQTYVRLRDGQAGNENVHLLVKGDVTRIKQLAEQYGGRFKYSYKQLAAVEIPEKNLLAFSKEYAVEQIENPNIYGQALMDTARIRNNINKVQEGVAPLPHDIKGRGVIVGIIDGGIYWQHKDFKRPDGTTRIRYIWDEGVTGANKPLPYNYGNEWNWIDIDNGNCTHVEPYNGTCSDSSHGTCIAGVAAGNGRSVEADSFLNEKYTGVAPESEIIAVRVDLCAANFAVHVADAVDYIFKKADALGRPCIINTSIGSYYGPHDGKDLTSQLIETLLDERNGRALVASAGNGGDRSFHLGYDLVSVDSAYTFFKYNNTQHAVNFDWWADTADFKNAAFAVGCNDTLGVNLGRTAYFHVSDFNPAPNSGTTIVRSLFDASGNFALGQINMQVSLLEGRYHCEVLVAPADVRNLWRLQTKGTGRFDLWGSEKLTGTSDVLELLNGNSIQLDNYALPDKNKTLTAGWQCSDKVITVGNYSNRANYLDVDSTEFNVTANFHNEGGTVVLYDEVVGKRYKTSSLGPTRDNRLKPDLMATGNVTMCTGDSNYIRLKLTNERYLVALGGKHLRKGGTSVSAAIVSGIAALYFEKRPTANYAEIKQALICTAVKDSFTGPTANNEYGNGKVDAFAALTQTTCITFGATDTACINYNALANVDSGTCVAKVYGCMDSTAGNYDPAANVSDGSCSYTGIAAISGPGSVRVIPNPFSGQTTFSIQGLDFETGEIRIYNQVGAIADVIKLNGAKYNYTYNNSKLQGGVYYYVLNADGRNVKAGKLVVE